MLAVTKQQPIGVKPVFGTMARDIRYIGPFGTGTKLKFIANLLVTVHNLAAAEALLMAQAIGYGSSNGL